METIITQKTIELAKDKGFTFNFKANNMSYGFDTFEDLEFEDVSQSVLAKWLREEHNIDVISYPSAVFKGKYIYLII